MTHETATPAARSQPRRARTARVAIALLAVALLALLLLRRCDKPPFDYFRHRAGLLGNDRARALAYVRDLPTLAYAGDVKGPLGALWHGAASPAEKRALSRHLLAHCPGAADATDAELGLFGRPDGPLGAASPPLTLTLTHRLLTPAGPVDQRCYEGPIGALVGDAHSARLAADATVVTVRADRGTPASERRVARPADATGEELVFRVARPGAEPLEVIRELWRADNRIGPDAPEPGARHDWVVLPCRVDDFVVQHEALRLAQAGRADAPEAAPYRALLDYARRADALADRVAQQLGVHVAYPVPRVLIYSTLPGGAQQETTPDVALDLRLDQAGFAGGDLTARYHATQVRSLLASEEEHRWLEQHTGAEVDSAFAAFGRLGRGLADSSYRRALAAARAVDVLLTRGRVGATATFTARATADGPPATVVATRTADGVRLTSGPQLGGAPLDHETASPGDAGPLVERALLCATAPRLPPDALLETDLDLGPAPLIDTGARLALAWGDGPGRTRQRVTVTRLDDDAGGATLRFAVGAPLQSARGELSLTSAALDAATSHNPYYRSGAREQADATSCVVSRAVYALLASDGRAPWAVQARRGPTDDPKAPRPLAWEGELVRDGRGTHEVLVNGAATPLPVLWVRAEGPADGRPPRFAILDDPRFPVGMAQALTRLDTSVRARLIDREGRGLAGATVALLRALPAAAPGATTAADDEPLAETTTGVDGRFTLPPLPRWGDARLRVVQRVGAARRVDTITVDWSAPGLAEQPVAVARLTVGVAWVTPATGARLDALPLSAQAVRHARRHLAQGRCVAIPEAHTEPGPLAFYSFDPATGHAIGVTEDGLHGAMNVWWARRAKLGEPPFEDENDGDIAGVSPIHMMRGANTAAYIYATRRLQGHDHASTIEKMLANWRYWEARTNLFGRFGEGVSELAGGGAAGEQLGDALSEQLGNLLQKGLPGADGPGAMAAFYLGYRGAIVMHGAVR